MRLPTFDGHNDVLSRLHGAAGDPVRRFLDGDGEGHVDLPRAEAGGFAGGCFAVFPCSPFRGVEEAEAVDYAAPVAREPALAEVLGQVALLLRIERAAGGRLRVARSAAELDGPGVAAVLHLEGAEPIDAGLEALDVLHAAGLRSLGLVWSRPNAFAEGAPFRFPSTPDIGDGLTEAGRRLVAECNRLGILIDLAHLNERGFWDVAAVSTAPLVASHSNAYALSANSRNLTDAQLDEIGSSGGIVGVTYHAGMLTEVGGLDPDVPLARVVDHVDYVVGRVGIDHVGFGSDFDGATVPTELGDAAGLQRVAASLRDRGYGDDEVAQLAHGNWLRVLDETWA